VGTSPALREVLRKLPRIAASDATVLILGESGTGKELVADALHRLSRRAQGPFVKLNCAALPETLLESELFGHGRGAFTGAHRETEGVFQAAHGGTLFLDEIAELAPALQPKLLRVLETGEFHRLGDSRRVVRVDVRLIAATNRDLPSEIAAARFRADLYYRLAVVPISLPPLRERREDLPALIEHLAERHGGASVRFTPEAMQALLDYDWPGNVRELSNAVESAIVLGDPGGIRVEHLPVAVQAASLRGPGVLPAQGAETLEDIEIRSIRQAMERAGGNRTRAATLLGVTRRTLGYRIQKYGLAFPARPGEAPRGGSPRTPLRVSPKPTELDERA
jgi:transcriptional regulator with GAF, ATPase, and Fis domain